MQNSQCKVLKFKVQGGRGGGRVVVVRELCAQGCGGSSEGLTMFFVVLCDDVVSKLCVRAVHSVSVRVRAGEKERQTEGT